MPLNDLLYVVWNFVNQNKPFGLGDSDPIYIMFVLNVITNLMEYRNDSLHQGELLRNLLVDDDNIKKKLA